MIQEYQTYAEAEAAGWIIRPPATIEYRGWYVISDQTRRGWRVHGREVTGKLVKTTMKWPTLKPALGNGLRMGFRTVRLHHGDQPQPTNAIRCAECRNNLGQICTMPQAIHVEDWEHARDQVMRLVDLRIDGKSNIPPAVRDDDDFEVIE